MYEVHIDSMEFKGKRTIQQHQLVNQVNYCRHKLWTSINCDKTLTCSNLLSDNYTNAFLPTQWIEFYSLQALKEEIQGMHGLRIFTNIPEK